MGGIETETDWRTDNRGCRQPGDWGEDVTRARKNRPENKTKTQKQINLDALSQRWVNIREQAISTMAVSYTHLRAHETG